MGTSVTVKTLRGNTTYYVSDVTENIRAWDDSVGNKFRDKAERAINHFNKNHETVWNKISKFPDVNLNDFKYESMEDKIEKLGV